MKRVLVACECSGTVRNAFRALGFDAWSCDFQLDDSVGQHIQGDVLKVLKDGWDLMIAHPPCTHLAVSGRAWFKYKQTEQEEALEFVRKLLNAPIPHIALENPVSVISSIIRKPDQVIQPWMFGEPFSKATCLWLKGLPILTPTKIETIRFEYSHNLPSSKDRAKLRSITYPGIADAMADQWSKFILMENIPRFYSPKDLLRWSNSRSRDENSKILEPN